MKPASVLVAFGLLQAGARAEAQSGPTSVQTQATVRLNNVTVHGNTVLPEAVIQAVVAPFVGRPITADDFEELRRQLTLAYVSRGYVSSGAILPEQNVSSGSVTYRIIEGQVTGISVTGNEHLNAGYVTGRLAGAVGPPININAVEQRVQLLLQDPSIARLNVEVVPDVGPGETRLQVDVKESSRYSLTASIANDESPDIGSVHGELSGVVRDLTGWGDALALHYGRTSGANLGGVSWSIPANAIDTSVSVRYDYNGAGVVSSQFQGLGISSVVHTTGIVVSQPVWRTVEQNAAISLGLDHSISETYLFKQPFSFASGYDNGEAQDTVLRLNGEWTDRTPQQVIALRATVSRGLPILDATNLAHQTNADFTVFLGQAQFVHTLIGSSQVVARAAAQLSTKPLFSFEQIALGGPNTVRGYVQNALVYDDGLIGSLETRIPVVQVKLPYLSTDDGDGEVQVAPFVDYGHGWNKSSGVPPDTIVSLGVGLRWGVARNLAAQIYYGYALNPISGASHNRGRNAVTFDVVAQAF